MNDISGVILQHINRYPKIRAADALKLIYQSEFGCGHMISNAADCYAYLLREWDDTPPATDAELYEGIGGGFMRLHISAAKYINMPAVVVNRIFMLSASYMCGTPAGFECKLNVLRELCCNGELPFDVTELDDLAADMRNKNYPPTHHTQRYRDAYHPAYRVVRGKYAGLISRIEQIIDAKGRAVVGIDGRCAAGKSTIAQTLADMYGGGVVHMDDFFLPPQLRTEERYAEPGGNIHHERFMQQVYGGLKGGGEFEYVKFDCATMGYGDTVRIPAAPLTVVEGCYCMRPEMRDAYDLCIFMNVEPDEQLRRIRARNGDSALANFINRWIPLEECYLEHYAVESQCGISL